MSLSGDMSTQIYSIGFHGALIETTVTNSCNVVDEWVNSTLLCRFHQNQMENGRLVVGLGTQCRPKGHTSRPDILTIQLCVGQRCLVFSLLQADAIPRSLIECLREERICFVGIHIKRHVKQLLRDWGLKVSHTMDLAEMAARKYNDGRLRVAQVEQATIEAYTSFLLGLKLANGADDDQHETAAADEIPILKYCSPSVPIPLYKSNLIDESYVLNAV